MPLISWKTVKMSFDRIGHTIILQNQGRRTRTTKYIKTKEEFSRYQWVLDNVWNQKFRWVEGVGIVGDKEEAEAKEKETLVEKRP